MRFPGWLPILAFAAFGFANQEPRQQSREDAQTFSMFAAHVREYVKMQKDLESSSSPAAGKSTRDSEQIADRQHELARRIAATRRGARQGDIFTHEVAKEFEKIIRKAFKEPGGRNMRRTIQEDGPVKPTVLHVNDVYPEAISRTTMPPTLLRQLPDLPNELAYRIIGRALALQDIKANLIVDFIPNAIP
jgi:hypothetical protein